MCLAVWYVLRTCRPKERTAVEGYTPPGGKTIYHLSVVSRAKGQSHRHRRRLNATCLKKIDSIKGAIGPSVRECHFKCQGRSRQARFGGGK